MELLFDSVGAAQGGKDVAWPAPLRTEAGLSGSMTSDGVEYAEALLQRETNLFVLHVLTVGVIVFLAKLSGAVTAAE